MKRGSTGNRVFVNRQGIIEIHVHGDQTIASVQAMGDEAIALGRQQRAARRRALILDNLFAMGAVPPAARKRVVELVQSTDYDKLAMVGPGTALRIGANLMLRATGRGRRVKYFDTIAAATAWLQAERG